MKLAIVDLDSTLCDISHRIHLLSKKDWVKFHLLCYKDKPNIPIINIVKSLSINGYYIHIMSGRSDIATSMTKKWLVRHCVPYNELSLKKNKDYTQDFVRKEKWLKEAYPDRKNLETIAIEDRTRVVEMWRKNGVTCLQVAEGDF